MTATPSAAEALRQVDLFAGLSRRALDKVAQTSKTVTHEQGKEIAIQGQEGIGFHLILEGSVDVAVNGVQAKTLGPGDYFGEISLIDGKPRSATITATTPLTTLSMVSWMFRPLLDEEPELTKALLLKMCERLRATQEL